MVKSGSEPEDFIPASIMPRQLRDKVVSKKLNEIEKNLVPAVKPNQNNMKE